MVLTDTFASDGGTYSCTAYNDLGGGLVASVFLNVLGMRQHLYSATLLLCYNNNLTVYENRKKLINSLTLSPFLLTNISL